MDSTTIAQQALELEARKELDASKDSLLSIHREKETIYQDQIEEVEKEKTWWKWGAIGTGALLVLKLIFSP